MNRDRSAFSRCHPLVSFLFYLFVIVYTILLSHPVYVAASFLLALLHARVVCGRRVWKTLLAILPLMLLVIVLNPLFNHYGTIPPLFYLGDKPITKEAVTYGFTSAFLLAAVLLWFAGYNRVVTSDKFTYLFGRLIPRLALLLSMALRLIPRMRRQLAAISRAQTMIGRGMGGVGVFKKIKRGLRILSVLVSWSLENGIRTADSMRARGYGARGRTSFSPYRLFARDKLLLALMALLAGLLVAAMALGVTAFSYRALLFPPWGAWDAAAFLCFVSFCLMPSALDGAEEVTWRWSISKI